MVLEASAADEDLLGVFEKGVVQREAADVSGSVRGAESCRGGGPGGGFGVDTVGADPRTARLLRRQQPLLWGLTD